MPVYYFHVDRVDPWELLQEVLVPSDSLPPTWTRMLPKAAADLLANVKKWAADDPVWQEVFTLSKHNLGFAEPTMEEITLDKVPEERRVVWEWCYMKKVEESVTDNGPMRCNHAGVHRLCTDRAGHAGRHQFVHEGGLVSWDSTI